MQRPEQIIHRAVVEHLRLRGAPGLVFFHPPMGMFYGGKRNKKGASIQGVIAKSLGVRAGVSDLILLHKGTAYALELKTEDGRSTESQDDFLADWQTAGGYGFVGKGLDKALAILECWGLLLGTSN